MSRFPLLSLCALGFVGLTLSGCGLSFPEADWMKKDPLAWMNGHSNKKRPNSDVEPPPGMALPEISGTDLETVPPFEPKRGGPLGSLGLNLDTYLSGYGDDDDRLGRLEKAVLAIQKDLRAMAPAVQRVASEERVQIIAPPPRGASQQHPQQMSSSFSGDARVPAASASVAGGHVAKGNVATQAPQPLTPQDAHMSPPPVSPVVEAGNGTLVQKGARDVSANQAAVSGIRVGEHSDRVRIVFDTTKTISYQADLDNTENILVVELPGVSWKPPALSESFGNMPLLKSYKVDVANGGKDHIFVMQLKKPTRILTQKIFPALSGTGKRVVIDLEK